MRLYNSLFLIHLMLWENQTNTILTGTIATNLTTYVYSVTEFSDTSESINHKGESWWTYCTLHFMLSQIFISFPDQLLYIVHNIYIYIYTCLTVCRLYMNNRRYKINLQWIICTQMGSGEKCWLDILLRRRLAVTGWIHYIQQNVSKSSQTGSSSSTSYFHIFFLIAFLEEAFIRNVI